MNEITTHPTSPKFFVVKNASAGVIAEAGRLAKANVNNAKVTPGGIIIHNSFRSVIETIARKEATEAVVAPAFSSTEMMVEWVYEAIGGKVAQEIARSVTAARFNERYAGMTVSEIKSKF